MIPHASIDFGSGPARACEGLADLKDVWVGTGLQSALLRGYAGKDPAVCAGCFLILVWMFGRRPAVAAVRDFRARTKAAES